MTGLTRRSLLLSGAGAAAAVASAEATARPARRADADTIVVGAGVFGAWTATRLRAAGQQVMLVDAWGPANARASSGGESRMTRGAYGADEVYTRMALESLEEWRALSERSGLPIFHQIGVLFFFPEVEPFLEDDDARPPPARPADRIARQRRRCAAAFRRSISTASPPASTSRASAR